MNDRAVSLFEEYDFCIEKTRKGRGSILAETDKGVMALVEPGGSLEHLALEECVLSAVSNNFEGALDLIVRTKEGELFCTDYEGKKYMVKRYVEGRECNVTDERECALASEGLARLHLAMRGLTFPGEQEYQPDDLMEDFNRRTLEIVRTRNYIRKSPRKEEFELLFLASYDRYMEQAAMVKSFLDEKSLQWLSDLQRKEKMLAHGDCTQHNVRFTEKGVTFINFEKVGAHLQVKDFYLLMRKVLEKNDWSYQMASDMLRAYEKVLPLSREEKNYLYTKFLYPEKYWKIANGYLNRKKSVPARRQQEKLLAFEQMEEKRQLFLNKWLETCR